MDYVVRFENGFGVTAVPGILACCLDVYIPVSADIADKSGLFKADVKVTITVPPGTMNKFLYPKFYEEGELNGALTGTWELNEGAVLAEWAEAGYPLFWSVRKYEPEWQDYMGWDTSDVVDYLAW